jgi:hypothetical protein
MDSDMKSIKGKGIQMGEMIKVKSIEIRMDQRQTYGDEKVIKGKDIVIRSDHSKGQVKRKRSKTNIL